jgi:hypothetical protein
MSTVPRRYSDTLSTLHRLQRVFTTNNPYFIYTYKANEWRIFHEQNTAATREDHARMRRLIDRAFSEQALRSQRSLVISYITLLINQLHKRVTSQEPVDMTRWLNFTTFDITGDLAFDESFNALENEVYNSWMYNLFVALRFASTLRVIKTYPIVGVPVTALLKLVPALAKAEIKHNKFIEERIGRWLNTTTMLSYAGFQ